MSDTKKSQVQVVDAEEVTPIAPATDPTTVGDTLSALQGLLERQAARVDELKHRIKVANDSMKSILENDEHLSEASVKAEQATKDVKEQKKKLTDSPEFREQRTKVVELRDELKELEETLNSHLLSYYQQTGIKTFDTSEGDQREFKVYAKVLPKKGGARD